MIVFDAVSSCPMKDGDWRFDSKTWAARVAVGIMTVVGRKKKRLSVGSVEGNI